LAVYVNSNSSYTQQLFLHSCAHTQNQLSLHGWKTLQAQAMASWLAHMLDGCCHADDPGVELLRLAGWSVVAAA
jgi:hypothetical protein